MGGPCGIVANMLDNNIVVSEFKLQLQYQANFQANIHEERYELLYTLAMGWIVSLSFFYKDGCGIKEPMRFDMPLNKETQQFYAFEYSHLIPIIYSQLYGLK